MQEWTKKPRGEYPNAGITAYPDTQRISYWQERNPRDGGGAGCTFVEFLGGEFHANLRNELGSAVLDEILAYVQENLRAQR